MRVHALLLLAPVLTGADLPIRVLDIGPDGAVAERAGALPADDATVSVPEAGIRSVTLAEQAAADWRWRPAGRVPADPAALARHDAALRARQEALTALEHAALHDGWLRGLLAQPATAAAEPERDAARLALVRDRLALVESGRRAAQAAVAAADRVLAEGPVERVVPAALEIPGGAGRAVRVVSDLPGLAWTPSYRIEVDGHGAAQLVRLAQVRWDGAAPLAVGRLVCRSRAPDRRLVLAPPSIPTIGVGESVAGFATPALLQGSESAVDMSIRRLVRSQRPEGSWGDRSADRPQSTALVLQAFLGAGYDHRVANPYRTTITKGLAWLGRIRPGSQDLGTAALVAGTLADALAMTDDADLRPLVRSWAADLARRVDRGAVDAALAAGDVVAVADLVLAAKTIAAADPEAGLDPARFAGLPRRLAAAGGEAGPVAAASVAAVLGEDGPLPPWWERAPAWIEAGRMDLVHHAGLAFFARGGSGWSAWNGKVRDLLVGWPGDTFPTGGRDHEAVLARSRLVLETYYRYDQVRGKKDGRADEGTARVAVTELPIDRLAQGWPVRWETGAVTLVPGMQAVEIDRTPLAATLAWRAVPLADPIAWRRLSLANPFPEALPEGPLVRIVDGRSLAPGRLPWIGPGDGAILDLGRDETVRVERTAVETSDDGWTRRTLTVALAFSVHAPAGRQVEVVEPMPVPTDDRIRYEITDPPLGRAQPERLRTDPFWRWTLADGGSATAGYRLVYPPDLRPQLEERP